MNTDVGSRLNQLLLESGLAPLDSILTSQFEKYLELLLRWNRKTNLTSIRDTDQILRRHFVESIVCAGLLPEGISTLLDFGTGAGFPGIPIALCRPEIAVTLAESQNKKAAFLQEAIRVLGLTAQVHAGRAESLTSRFDCVTLRAADRMEGAVSSAAARVREGGWFAILGTTVSCSSHCAAAGTSFRWNEPNPIPSSEQRILSLARNIEGGG